MTTKSLNRFAVLSKLDIEEKRFRQEFAKIFLEYLATLSLKKQIEQIESICFETEIKHVVTLNNRLSKPEKRCLFLAYKGNSTKDMSRILKRSINTIETHRRNIFKKLNVDDMPQAIALGIKYRIIK